jgi:type 1 glutamine amidotransferase
VDYLDSGRPIMGLRTATHAFAFAAGSGAYEKYGWNYHGPDFDGGFGRQVLGETWINHWGRHGSQSTRGIIAPGAAADPILRGIKDGDIWCKTDVYQVRLPMIENCRPLVLGQVLTGMEPTSPPDPAKTQMMPIAWTKTYTGESGKPDRIFVTTMGHVKDFENEGFRRLLVNACYWAMGLEKKISPRSNVEFVGPYNPSPIGERK